MHSNQIPLDCVARLHISTTEPLYLLVINIAGHSS